MDETKLSSNLLLKCCNLGKSYKEFSGLSTVLSGVNLELYPNEKVAIMGCSGSGKSTLLGLLAGLDTSTTGSVYLLEKNLSNITERERCKFRNKHLGFVYQFHHLLSEFTVLENVCIPALIGRKSIKESRRRALYLLKKVGLGHRLEHRPHALSGGERQRVAIARALINCPSLVLLDEPTGNLDTLASEVIKDLIFEISEDNETTFLVATHDTHLATQMDRILYLHEGNLHSENPEYLLSFR